MYPKNFSQKSSSLYHSLILPWDSTRLDPAAFIIHSGWLPWSGGPPKPTQVPQFPTCCGHFSLIGFLETIEHAALISCQPLSSPSDRLSLFSSLHFCRPPPGFQIPNLRKVAPRPILVRRWGKTVFFLTPLISSCKLGKVPFSATSYLWSLLLPVTQHTTFKYLCPIQTVPAKEFFWSDF